MESCKELTLEILKKEASNLVISVEHTTETISGKVYPLTITRQEGYQKIRDHGEEIEIESMTIFDSPLGQSICYTRLRPEVPPEVRARNLQHIKDVAKKALIDQGIW